MQGNRKAIGKRLRTLWRKAWQRGDEFYRPKAKVETAISFKVTKHHNIAQQRTKVCPLLHFQFISSQQLGTGLLLSLTPLRAGSPPYDLQQQTEAYAQH